MPTKKNYDQAQEITKTVVDKIREGKIKSNKVVMQKRYFRGKSQKDVFDHLYMWMNKHEVNWDQIQRLMYIKEQGLPHKIQIEFLTKEEAK